MRWAVGFIVPVLLAAGCTSTGPFASVEDPGPPNGDKDRTLEYWNGLRGGMSQRSNSDDLRALANLVRRQAETIRSLSPERVDPELVEAAEAVAKCQERVIELAEIANFQLAGLRASPAPAREFAQANQRASAAATRLAQLHARLSARYGTTFSPFER
jgi:hypothetical protein